jgi:hypothetical protein
MTARNRATPRLALDTQKYGALLGLCVVPTVRGPRALIDGLREAHAQCWGHCPGGPTHRWDDFVREAKTLYPDIQFLRCPEWRHPHTRQLFTTYWVRRGGNRPGRPWPKVVDSK